ncbi:hypothetical protein BJV82DRAFT_584198 [Fennellomyces sp. T-0311]|nr:hypothetical protein BJV82DRAFT_584198 [Fennellomyces sp. T-0311]
MYIRDPTFHFFIVQRNTPARTRTETERNSDLAEIFRQKEVEITGKSVKRFLWYQYEKVEDRDGKCCYRNKKRHVDIVEYNFKKYHAVKPKHLSAEAQDLLDKVNSNEVKLLRSENCETSANVSQVASDDSENID